MDASRQAIEEARRERAKFIERVRAAERLANENPLRYRRRVMLLAAIGYGYIFLILALSLLVLACVVWMLINTKGSGSLDVRLIIVVVFLIFTIIKSLWVKIEAPEGLYISRSDAPTLYKTVDDIADAIHAPKPSQIILDLDLNAAAVQRPRLGVFGWYENYVVLGWQLLEGLPYEEVRGIIAHELGHLSADHGRFGLWAYRIDETWNQLRENMSKGGYGLSIIFRWFVRWFSPRFSALTFAVRRADEYEADRSSVQLVGAKTAASALMRLHVKRKVFSRWADDEYWREVTKASAYPAGILDRLTELAAEPTTSEEYKTIINTRLKDKTGFSSTHPSLSDRIQAMGDTQGAIDEAVSQVAETAAVRIFGNQYEAIKAKIAGHEHDDFVKEWTRQSKRYTEWRSTLKSLEEKRDAGALTEPDRVLVAVYRDRLESSQVGMQLYKELYDEGVVSPILFINYGFSLLDEGDRSGIELIERALELDPNMREHGQQRIARFYWETGDHESLDNLNEVRFDAQIESQEVDQERRKALVSDEFIQHTLGSVEVEQLRESLLQIEQLRLAYLVSKKLSNGTSTPFLFVFGKPAMLDKPMKRQALQQAVIKKGSFPKLIMVFAPENPKVWKKRLNDIPGSILIDRLKK